MIPLVCRKLIDYGYNVKWHLVGDGPLRTGIEQVIQKYNDSINVILTKPAVR